LARSVAAVVPAGLVFVYLSCLLGINEANYEECRPEEIP